MEDVTRRAAVTAATVGAVGAAVVGSQANAQDQVRGSQRLLAEGLSLEPRPLDKQALVGLVNRLAELKVVWQDWHPRGIPPVVDRVNGRFTVPAETSVEVVSYLLRNNQILPNIVIFPNGIPPVYDSFNVAVEINAR
jgi:hypothetical protein